MDDIEKQSMEQSYELRALQQAYKDLLLRVERVEQKEQQFEVDRNRWIGGFVVLTALGGIVTWFLSTYASVRGIK